MPLETDKLEQLKSLERSRMLKLWHDHSDVLNHTYISFMLSVIYDPALFLTNDEYRNKYPERPKIDVQSVIERPHLYILGRSKSTDDEQLGFVNERVKDLQDLHEPIYIEGVPIRDNLRIFSGDGPARQFEAGQQRGGNFSCICGIRSEDHNNLQCSFLSKVSSLEERRQVFTKGLLWRNLSTTSCPFRGLRKDDIAMELEARGYNTLRKSKPELQQQLQEELHGIQRPPALICPNPEKTANSINCSLYEVIACEPLHDITNIVEHIIVELPCHIKETDVQKQFEQFSESTVAEKNQLKGSDARLYAVKLAKFVQNLHKENKLNENVLKLCNSLVEIINICYRKHDTRNQQQILRLYNQRFVFSLACLKVVGAPRKMNSTKFYGSHFHCLVTHAPEVYRLLCLRSVIVEEEERSFGDLRSISKSTSNRQPEYTLQNAVLRFNAQQESHSIADSLQKQESVISQQAKFLDKKTDTRFHITDIIKNPYLYQCHLQRISDFLLCGKGVWWSLTGSAVVFHDATGRSSSHISGPPLHQLRSTTLVEEQSYLSECWKDVINKVENGSLQVPLHKIKKFTNDVSYKIIYTEIFEEDNPEDSIG